MRRGRLELMSRTPAGLNGSKYYINSDKPVNALRFKLKSLDDSSELLMT